MKVNKKLLLIVPAILMVSALILSSGYSAPTSTASTTSNVTVNTYVSISLTNTLQGGVQFGNLNPGTTNSSSTTCAGLACNITVSVDSNVNVDLKIKDNAPLTSGSNTIPNSGYYFNTSATAQPVLPAQSSLDTTYYEFATGVSGTNGVSVIQFWLNVPSTQAPGTYNNTISFCGEEAGTTTC